MKSEAELVALRCIFLQLVLSPAIWETIEFISSNCLLIRRHSLSLDKKSTVPEIFYDSSGRILVWDF